MRFISVSVLSVSFISSLVSGALGSGNLLGRTDATTDLCGEIDVVFKVPNFLLPGKFITLGNIQACLCLSDISHFMTFHPLAISASVLVGKPKVTEMLTDMVKGCNAPQTCHYPPHSVAMCQHGNPCSFTCKDGYTPYPADRPTQCVCNKPYTECNGMCGYFYACPSGHAKRDLFSTSDKRCPLGYKACGVLGRNKSSWECVSTQTDLESCGGCAIPLNPSAAPDGEDCTSLPGVSDVSCIRGGCVVHRCMPGYEVSASGASCVYNEDKDPVLLAAQYGLEHTPL